MPERILLKLANFAEQQLEKKPENNEGTLFVPRDTNLREISEALFIDGALPSEINHIVLSTNPADAQIKPDTLNSRLSEIRDSLELEGADVNTAKQIISVAKKELTPQKQAFLAPYQPLRKVDLRAYRKG